MVNYKSDIVIVHPPNPVPGMFHRYRALSAFSAAISPSLIISPAL